MSEKELIQRAQAGDFEAFAQLVAKHQKQVFGLARRLTGNIQDAEDLVQETLLKAIDNIDKFRGDSAFGTWLYSIALNQGRAHYNRAKKTDLQSLDDLLPLREHNHGTPSGHLHEWRDPHTLLEQDELSRLIAAAFAELPPEYAIPFSLRYEEELSIKEIAEVLGITEAATKSRVLRARLFMRNKLDAVLGREDRDQKVH